MSSSLHCSRRSQTHSMDENSSTTSDITLSKTKYINISYAGLKFFAKKWKLIVIYYNLFVLDFLHLAGRFLISIDLNWTFLHRKTCHQHASFHSKKPDLLFVVEVCAFVFPIKVHSDIILAYPRHRA